MCCLLLSMLLIFLLEVMLFTTKLSLYNGSTFLHDEGIFAFIVALISLVLFISPFLQGSILPRRGLEDHSVLNRSRTSRHSTGF